MTKSEQIEVLRQALSQARDSLDYYRSVFGHPNFTDRHDDEGRCRRMVERCDAALKACTPCGGCPVSRPPSEPGWYWAKLQLHVHRVSDWKPTWWDQPADLIAEWGPRIPEPSTPGPATEGGLEDDVRALLDAWDDCFCGDESDLTDALDSAIARLRARLGAGGGA